VAGRLPRWLFATAYDRVLAGAEQRGLRGLRQRLLARAAGRTLELGAGTGLNAPHWPSDLPELVLSEPDRAMARRLEARLPALGPRARSVRCAAEDLPFEHASFDTVVARLVLCTVRDPHAALAEARRVLAPGGRLLFLEHVRSDDECLARWQDRLSPLHRWLALGCELNRPTGLWVEAAGFRLDDFERLELPGVPALARPAVLGSAVAP
jgi:ubiquinone/menaquinone biosynthesis C-methylase UbiE